MAAITGLVLTAGTTAYSFAQAASQKKEQTKAENEAAKFLADARKKLEVNFYDQLAIQKEPYQLAREAALTQGAQAIQAGVESERGAAATAGRIQLAQQEEQRKIAAAMGQEMAGLEKLSAAEESRLRDMQSALDIREATGAQRAAAVAEARSAQALAQGMQGVASFADKLTAAMPDYEKSQATREVNKMEKLAMGKDNALSQADFQKSIASLGVVGGVDFSKVGAMNPIAFESFMGSVNPNVLQQLRQQLPNALQSFRPADYALPTTQFSPSLYGFNIPSIGGQ